MTDQHQYNNEFCEFLAHATTPFHAVSAMLERLEAGGFTALNEADAWQLQPGAKHYVTRNDSSVVAFIVGAESAPDQGVRMVGAHTDSPCLMVKPKPEKSSNGYFQLAVEVYGGVLLNPWFDRDLSLAGRVSFANAQGDLQTALIDFREAIATIPSLAIHLDREVNSKRSINAQTDILPILMRCPDQGAPDFRALLQQRLQTEHPQLEVAQLLDYELGFYDTQPPALIGLEREFLASARLDNLLSCYAGLSALLSADGKQSALLVCNDHEEVGSMSAAGAQGPLLRSVLQRLAPGSDQFGALVQQSLLISADNAHGVHPNFAHRHDDNHGPVLNDGPVIKINANQRYASNSETAGFYRLLSQAEDVPVQAFVVRSDMACGSTIGPISAAEIGVRTLDIGVPTFAMHSIRELAGSADAYNLSRVLGRFFSHPGPLAPTV